ncbi:MAG TPA: D-aminoacyl-tRNA deacylase [Candidatus Bathyarchaeia archaeon]|nr:D-aminoacyl-tRNA deacylase [Candidatus Bathyarchaeia archaeon]
MKIVIQRVSQASVSVEGKTVGQINAGALVFLGVAKNDTSDDAKYLVRKAAELRMFADENGKMNVGAKEAGAEFLVISQFTLYGDCKKGRRPSFDDAALPEKGKALYEEFVVLLRAEGFKVETGIFGAMMKVSLVNDGPVTFIVKSEG